MCVGQDLMNQLLKITNHSGFNRDRPTLERCLHALQFKYSYKLILILLE